MLSSLCAAMPERKCVYFMLFATKTDGASIQHDGQMVSGPTRRNGRAVRKSAIQF